MSLMVLHISLILLKLIGSKDLFQFCLISLAIGLHFLTASLELSLLLLCELWTLLVTTWLLRGGSGRGISFALMLLAVMLPVMSALAACWSLRPYFLANLSVRCFTISVLSGFLQFLHSHFFSSWAKAAELISTAAIIVIIIFFIFFLCLIV